jgi:molybdate-binding protein/DNA-binding PadR family transcriptional regulator
MSVAHVILGLLASGERCGYELRDDLEREFGPEWRIDFGQLYRVLASTQRAGWTQVRTVAGTRAPDRKMYHLTQRGRSEFRRWLEEPRAHVGGGRDDLPAKLRFALARGAGQRPSALNSCVDERHHDESARLQIEQSASENARREGDTATWLVADRHRREAEAILAWLDTCRGILATKARRSHEQLEVVRFAGSDDLLLDLLAGYVTRSPTALRFDGPRAGSLGGLMALREGRAEIAGVHLLDTESGEYNVPFVKHLLPEEPIILITLAQREQGILVATGNPKRILGVRDLARRHVRLINRQPGAGTRLLLFHHLRRNGIDPRTLRGYDREVATHSAVAAAIKAGTADAGPGIRAAAEAWSLDFVPLARERYDLAVPRRVFEAAAFRPVLEAMQGREFASLAATMPGYDTSEMGRIAADLR